MRSYQLSAYGGPLEMAEAQTPVPSGTKVLVRACGVGHSDVRISQSVRHIGQRSPLTRRSTLRNRHTTEAD